MKLTELNPKWINGPDGRSGVGVRFWCPCCNGGCVLAVLSTNPIDGGPAIPAGANLMGENQGRRWGRTGETFETLSITPSIDASPEHWHGFITNGDATP